MLKIKLIILGVLLNVLAVYPYFDPITIPPVITSVTNVTSTGFTVIWSSAVVIDLKYNYYLKYIVLLTGVDQSQTIYAGDGQSAAFSGLRPSTSYSITIETTCIVDGPVPPLYISPTTSYITTAEDPHPVSTTNSTDYTRLTPRDVIIRAQKSITLANGFRYKATDGNSLITIISPKVKNSDSSEGYTIYPESYHLDINNQRNSLKNNTSIVSEYQISQYQQGSLIIKDGNFNYSTAIQSGYYEIIDIKMGRISKRGSLSGYETMIDTSDLNAGIYVVRVTKGSTIYTKKIMLNK